MRTSFTSRLLDPSSIYSILITPNSTFKTSVNYKVFHVNRANNPIHFHIGVTTLPIIIDQARLTFFKEQFERRFSRGTEPSDAFKSAVADERQMKVDLKDRVNTILKQEKDASVIGEQFYKAVSVTVSPVHKNSIAKIKDLKNSDIANYKYLFSLYGNVLTSDDEETSLFRHSYEKIEHFHHSSIKNTPERSDMVYLLFAALSSKPYSKTIIGRVRFFGEVTKFFLGTKLLTSYDKNVEDSLNQLNGIVAKLFDEMSNWGWSPEDTIDIQCALWLEFKVDNLESYKSYSST